MKTMYQTYHDQQKAEIATIKPRTISLNLSDADMERLAVKAALVGRTPSKLLQSFIGDLVNGTYSNGSDERMMANDWFDRCGFDYCGEKTFLRFLLRWDMLSDVVECWNTIQIATQELNDATDDEERSELTDELERLNTVISEQYAKYQLWNANDDKKLEDAVSEVARWAESTLVK